MTKVNVYSVSQDAVTKATLPKVFAEPENMALLAQAIHVYRAREHAGLSKVKTRSEVVRTTKKWYRQKGTGRARHGARSAPIFVGGGVAHGPKGVKRKRVLPRKMKQKALRVALGVKARDKRIVFVKGLSLLKKTKDAQSLLDKIILGEKISSKNPRFTFIISDRNSVKSRFLRNMAKVRTMSYKSLNAYAVFLGGVLVFDKSLFDKKKTKK